ncbi:MAG TPA: hypothetical protein VFP47_09345, partial [Pyrinomonadaceae bacterium]|nr:hypothetical protein [Pyrinomonadaceae bacterium]
GFTSTVKTIARLFQWGLAHNLGTVVEFWIGEGAHREWFIGQEFVEGLLVAVTVVNWLQFLNCW